MSRSRHSSPRTPPTLEDSGSPASASSPRATTTTNTRANRRLARKYGFACLSCKLRKVKCNGDHPVCASCRRSGNECVWPAESVAETRLREANARIRHLEASLGSSSSPEQGLGHQAHHSRRDSEHHHRAASFSRDRPQAAPLANTLSGSSQALTPPTPNVGTTTTTAAAAANRFDAENEQIWFEVGVGEDGTVTYNGPTSRFHAGGLEENRVEDSADNSHAQLETLRSQYTLMDSVWLPLIATKPYMGGTGVTTEVGLKLLDIYWTWLHPLHSCVYRPSLIMDLALGGPYCSDFLLMCIFGLAARHLQQDQRYRREVEGEDFISRAKMLLLEEMSAPRPAIPTIQGLLILGGRQCAAGKSSEGWLYTGMAIRMMKDIGLHLDTSRLAGAERWTPAEREVRRRLYNSAYIWDKTLSLALGRLPSVTRLPYTTAEILDKFDDQRVWTPVHSPEIAETFAPTPAMSSSTFCAFCSIHTITTDMLLLFSNTSTSHDFATSIEELGERCNRWYEELPNMLRIVDAHAMTQSPPPHVVSLKYALPTFPCNTAEANNRSLLYHSLHILLRRPSLISTNPDLRNKALAECITHSKAIHSIHLLFTKSFPQRLMTYQVSYCIFTAATVEAQLLRTAASQQEREDAAMRLSAAVRVLQDEAIHTPGSGRSLDTIRRLLSAGQQQSPNTDLERQSESSGQTGYQANGNMGLPSAPVPATSGWGELAHNTMPVTSPVTNGHANGGGGFRHEDYPYPNAGQPGGSSYVPLGGVDTGAGFQPDAFPWAIGLTDSITSWWHETVSRSIEPNAM